MALRLALSFGDRPGLMKTLLILNVLSLVLDARMILLSQKFDYNRSSSTFNKLAKSEEISNGDRRPTKERKHFVN